MELKLQCTIIYGIRCKESKKRQYLLSRKSIGPELGGLLYSVWSAKSKCNTINLILAMNFGNDFIWCHLMYAKFR